MDIRKSILLSLLIVSAGVSHAQGYYDDDIYFNSSKDKDKNVELAKKQAEEAKRKANSYILYPVSDYAAADTYAPEGSSTMSVDRYNRRGIFAKDSVMANNASENQDFTYTRKIEKFYNPAVVAGSNDAELAELYYAEPVNLNIYVNNLPYGYWGYSWNGWYNDWYPGYWGPSWSWNWGPSWSWSPSWNWGWGPSWAWRPSWSWGWAPSWNWRPSWAWTPARPYNHRHPGALGNSRPSYGTAHRPSSGSGNSGYRPAYNNNRHNGSASRPSYNINNSSSNRNNNTYSRPGRNNNSSSNNNSYRYNSNSSNNNSNSSNSNRSTTGSYRGSNGSYNGGGSRSNGGGRGRH